MFGINLKHSLAAGAVAVGVLAAAGPASAGALQPGVVAYNGHAGLGASVYQHNQTDLEFSDGFGRGPDRPLAAGVSDGTSNTIMFGARAAAFAVESLHRVLRRAAPPGRDARRRRP